MEEKGLERRSVLKGSAATLATIGSGASTAMIGGERTAFAQVSPPQLPEHLASALARFRAAIPPNFDPDYIEHVLVPFFLTSVYDGERPMLPLIDVNFSKENALPFDLWGLIYRNWQPTPENGVTVFLQGLEKRGDNNLRKRIYFSAGDS